MTGRRTLRRTLVLAMVGLGLGLVCSARAAAHCDTMEGPVVKSARAALAKGDVTPVLKWVKQENEAEIRDIFAKALVS